MIQKHKLTIQSIKEHARSQYKQFYPLILGYLFAIFVLVLVSLLLSMSAIGGLAQYEDFLLHDLKPTYETTGEVSQQQLMQFEAFGSDMYEVLFELGIITLLSLIGFTVIKTFKDIFLWKQIKKSFSIKKHFWKFSLQTFLSVLGFALIALYLMIFFPYPIFSLFLIVLSWLLFETITLTLQARNKTPFFTKKTVQVFLATLFTGIIFIIIWWLGLLLVALAFSWSSFLLVFFALLLFILLYSKRSLYLFYISDALFYSPKAKRIVKLSKKKTKRSSKK